MLVAFYLGMIRFMFWQKYAEAMRTHCAFSDLTFDHMSVLNINHQILTLFTLFLPEHEELLVSTLRAAVSTNCGMPFSLRSQAKQRNRFRRSSCW